MHKPSMIRETKSTFSVCQKCNFHSCAGDGVGEAANMEKRAKLRGFVPLCETFDLNDSAIGKGSHEGTKTPRMKMLAEIPNDEA